MAKNTEQDTAEFSLDSVMENVVVADKSVMARPHNGAPSVTVVNERVTSKVLESWNAGSPLPPLSVSMAGRNVKATVGALRASVDHLNATEGYNLGLSVKVKVGDQAPTSKLADVPDDATPVVLYFMAQERKDTLSPDEQAHAKQLGFVMPKQQEKEHKGRMVKFYETPTLREQYRLWQAGKLAAPNDTDKAVEQDLLDEEAFEEQNA